jgi:hypothetical protein
MLILSFLALIFLNSPLQAKDDFSLDYPSCRIRLESGITPLDSSLVDVLKERLKFRKLVFMAMPSSKRIGMDQLYLQLERKMVGTGFYKKCQMKLSLLVTRSDLARPNRDKKLFVKAVRRQYPRLTLGGIERCKLAIKDIFIHVPPCHDGGRSKKKSSSY